MEVNKKGAKGKHAKKADTLAELALKMDVDPGVLIETVERYYKICESGKDPDFRKSRLIWVIFIRLKKVNQRISIGKALAS